MHSQYPQHSQDHKLLSLFDPEDILVAEESQWSVGLLPLDRPCLQLTNETNNYDHLWWVSNKRHNKYCCHCVTGEEAAVPLVLKWRVKPLLVPKLSEVKRIWTRFEWVRRGDGGGVRPQNGPRVPEGVSICKQNNTIMSSNVHFKSSQLLFPDPLCALSPLVKHADVCVFSSKYKIHVCISIQPL